jgi:hypothetical protein
VDDQHAEADAQGEQAQADRGDQREGGADAVVDVGGHRFGRLDDG